jgi:ATP-dependent DNA helicase RecQ
MKLSKEPPEREKRAERKGGRRIRGDRKSIVASVSVAAAPQAAKQLDNSLFEFLRKLRAEVARGQGVPAYVVFTDSALADMCVKIPKTKEEFLDVSGVGQVKLEKYGEVFLGAIEGYLGN